VTEFELTLNEFAAVQRILGERGYTQLRTEQSNALHAKLLRLNTEVLLDAERAREERNREHVRLNSEWMAKCEKLRAKVVEECAIAAWSSGMDSHKKAKGMPVDSRECGSYCASAIRSLAKKEGA
jgi:hypothetical protein